MKKKTEKKDWFEIIAQVCMTIIVISVTIAMSMGMIGFAIHILKDVWMVL